MTESPALPAPPPEGDPLPGPAGSAGWMPAGFVERIGAALVAPRRALAATEAEGLAGKGNSDVVVLIAMLFLAAHTREIVIGAWVFASESAWVGLNVIFQALSRAVAMDLAFLCVAAVLLTVAAGERRAPGRDFDLACVAFVPYLVVKLVASLALLFLGAPPPHLNTVVLVVAGGFSAAVLFLAWQIARSRVPARPHAAARSGREGAS